MMAITSKQIKEFCGQGLNQKPLKINLIDFERFLIDLRQE
jgi:hypothetical protein